MNGPRPGWTGKRIVVGQSAYRGQVSEHLPRPRRPADDQVVDQRLWAAGHLLLTACGGSLVELLDGWEQYLIIDESGSDHRGVPQVRWERLREDLADSVLLGWEVAKDDVTLPV